MTEHKNNNEWSKKHWVIAGAGSIGLWLGAHLCAVGHKVTFLARPRIIQKVNDHGMHITSWQGKDLSIPADRMTLTEDDQCISDADVIVIAVKSKDTFAIGEQISRLIKPNALVISAQNGINNASALRNILPDHQVASLMVPYNVLPLEGCRYHCGTEGILVIDHAVQPIAEVFNEAGLETKTSKDMHAVLWGKLLLNLNNPLNALSGMTLVDELSDRRWRKKLADCMDETLDVLNEIGIEPEIPSPLPASWLPTVLRLPTVIFKLLAKRMLQMDPLARSSMQEDIDLGRSTEIDYINGEVVLCARSLGMNTPINEQVISEIKKLEQSYAPA